MGKEIPIKFELEGLLKKIVSYKSHHSSTTGPSGHPVVTNDVTTHLELLTDDNKSTPIDFNAYVGSELVGKRVTYLCCNEVIEGEVETAVGKRNARQKLIKQQLVPVNPDLPSYVTTFCEYIG